MEERRSVPTRLSLPRAEVEEKLAARISAGREIQNLGILSEEGLEGARAKRTKWNAYNIELLKRCFEPDSIAEEYESVSLLGVIYTNAPLSRRVESFRAGLGKKLTCLESILERLDLIPGDSRGAESSATTDRGHQKNAAFIVHGSDEAAKTRVARFVDRLGVRAVVLHEQPNRGQTIIEKFESNAADVGFAIVLLTADDVGAPKNSLNSIRPRARQNVLLELGYFCAALGREKVCVLYEDGVEIPSDYLGVVYTPFDSADGWQLRLAKEMKEAGLDIDLNRVI
ncbi:MAG: hypothetical protein A2X76_03140 [Lysobacterales bacterium GWF1_69_6]|nr:MAG: hypothetical protein A2X76_03140 [Xanthomonadales bacterium GWF1_69_6]